MGRAGVDELCRSMNTTTFMQPGMQSICVFSG